jgi:zinc protease
MSVRLRFDVGASAEGDREQGQMHLIEHLIFHGTPNIPEGSLPLMLAHRGMRHWSDMDAYTSYDETVFRLEMSRADAPARTVSLMLMHEIATNLVFDRRTVEAAKRKVREEIKARGQAQDGIITAQNALFAPGTPIARGTVTGTDAQVRRARPEAIRRLYKRYYVPGRATLVLVGDFDPELAEREIAVRFSGWQRGTSPASPAVMPPNIVARSKGALFVHTVAPTTVTIARATRLGGGSDVGRRRDAHFLELLGAGMLNRRLRTLAAAPHARLAGGELSFYDHFATVRLARLDLEPRDRDWRGAMAAGAAELRRAIRDGFSQDELDAELAAMRDRLTRAAAPATNRSIADAIVDAVNRAIVFTAPADRSGTDAYLAAVRLSDINSAFRAAWGTDQPLLFVSHNRRVAGGEAALHSAWDLVWD